MGVDRQAKGRCACKSPATAQPASFKKILTEPLLTKVAQQ